MKRLIVSSLFVGLISVMNAPALRAETESDIKPNNLVSLGYNGYFQSEGIPGYTSFITAVQMGKVDAEQLVKIAVDTGRLSPETLNDSNYLNAVKLQLNNVRPSR